LPHFEWSLPEAKESGTEITAGLFRLSDMLEMSSTGLVDTRVCVSSWDSERDRSREEGEDAPCLDEGWAV